MEGREENTTTTFLLQVGSFVKRGRAVSMPTDTVYVCK